jgi:hypothetical protein
MRIFMFGSRQVSVFWGGNNTNSAHNSKNGSGRILGWRTPEDLFFLLMVRNWYKRDRDILTVLPGFSFFIRVYLRLSAVKNHRRGDVWGRRDQ